jgi:hypothetical protein
MFKKPVSSQSYVVSVEQQVSVCDIRINNKTTLQVKQTCSTTATFLQIHVRKQNN